MRQLTWLDATFLNLESATTFGHVSQLTLLDPSTRPSGELTLEDVKAGLQERLHLLPPFRWRLAQVPFDLDYPYWVESPEFDLDFHLRELGLPSPGDDRQLAEQVARLHARPLDRSRPLWELYLIYGHQSGYVGQFTKIHHACIDGASGAEIMSVLLDRQAEPAEVPKPDERWRPERAPGQAEMLWRGLSGALVRPLRGLRAVPRLLPKLDNVPVLGTLPGVGTVSGVSGRVARTAGLAPRSQDGAVIERPAGKAPRTPFNTKITAHRRFAFGSLPLSEVKLIKDAFGLTINDVVMALCAGALRRWLIDHGALPEESLLAGVPVSVRTEEQSGTFGNQVSAMIAPIFTNVADPLERVRAIHGAMSGAKERHGALPATLLQDFDHFITPAVATRASRVVMRLGASTRIAPPFNVAISNVPGPQVPLYSTGARVMAGYPVSVVMDGAALNMTVMSYNGHLDFGIVSCREVVPDLWPMMQGLRESLNELRSLAETTAANEAKT